MKMKFICNVCGHEFESDATWREPPSNIEQKKVRTKGAEIKEVECRQCGSKNVEML